MRGAEGVNSDRSSPVTSGATAQTVNLYRWLKTQKQTRCYAFGSNDMLSTMPGTSSTPQFYNTAAVFESNSGRYPGCMGFEYHDSGWTSRYGSVATDATRAAIQAAYAKGCIIMLHHHAGNPVTGSLSGEGTLSTFNNPFGTSDGSQSGNVYDRNGSPLDAINTGGAQEAQYLAYLDRLATFLASLVDTQGRLIPVIWRPFHEVSGAWFWWGGADRVNAFKQVWIKMVSYLRTTKGVTNALYCFNGDVSVTGYSAWYPGDVYVDVVSLDAYDASSDGSASLERSGTTMVAYNQLVTLSAKKALILAELGYTSAAQSVSNIWDVRTGLPLANKFSKFALAACWRTPFGPGASDSTEIKGSLTNMVDSVSALTADKLTGVFS